jgi:hypothetical protein
MNSSLPDARGAGPPGAQLLARAIAGHGLGSRLAMPTSPIPDPAFGHLLEIGHDDRLTGAIVQAVTTRVLPVTEHQLQMLTEQHAIWCQHALEVERILIQASTCFRDAGVQSRVLKGVALAHLAYDNPSWRVFGDLDVIVPSHQFDHAVELARNGLGGVQLVPELRPGFDHEFGKEALVRVGAIEFDIHRTFVSGPFGLTINLDDLFLTETLFEVGGGMFAALDPVSMFVHAAYNLALGDFPVRLCSLRDLLIIHQQLDVELADVAAVAQAWRATAVVQRAAQLAIELLNLGPGHQLEELARLEVPRRETWMLRSYLTPARSYSRPLASLAVIPGIRKRFRYARAIMAPSSDYLASRGWTESSHLRRAGDRLLRRV